MRISIARCTRVAGSPISRRFDWRLAWSSLLLTALLACSSGPPPDFAPDPGLIAQIDQIRIHPRQDWACPGQTIRVDYDAVLQDGSVIPFSRRYDEDDPPPLHVVFLRRASPDAEAQGSGDWTANPDPLATAMEGFRLRAELIARPGLSASTVVAPEYSCQRHRFRFVGRNGARGESGMPGPDVLVRLNVLRSPFVARLLVVTIEVGDAPPFYVLHDADAIPPADWLVVESRGGKGGR
ncbi:MAG: hypothetical protein PVH40_09675, partial [Gemmatimonadales bacterium]